MAERGDGSLALHSLMRCPSPIAQPSCEYHPTEVRRRSKGTLLDRLRIAPDYTRAGQRIVAAQNRDLDRVEPDVGAGAAPRHGRVRGVGNATMDDHRAVL